MKKKMRPDGDFPWLQINVLSLLQCCDTVGWKRSAFDLQITCAACTEGFSSRRSKGKRAQQ